MGEVGAGEVPGVLGVEGFEEVGGEDGGFVSG